MRRFPKSGIRFVAMTLAATILAVGLQLAEPPRDGSAAAAAKSARSGRSAMHQVRPTAAPSAAAAGHGTASVGRTPWSAGGGAASPALPSATGSPPAKAGAAPSSASADSKSAATIQLPPVEPWQAMPGDLQETIGSFLQQQGAAGIAVGIGTAQGRFLSLNGYSDMGAGTPLQETDRSAFRSITKSFVGTVVLQLVAEGKLGLDDPVVGCVPGIPDSGITVRMALEMRTGLVEYSDTQEFSDQMNSAGGYTWTD
ncbi:MAG TPA: serine hydrolase domain-containing protein, partial [Micrococcaceae bacterium]